MHRQTQGLALTLVLMTGLAVPAMSQVQRAPPPGGANPQAMQQLQQAAAERSALQADNARLKKELDDTKAKLATATRDASGSKLGSAALRAELTAAQAATRSSEQAHEQTRARLQELLERFRQTTGSLAGAETERGQLKQELAAANSRLDVCAERNVALYDAMNEGLDKLGKGGFFKAMGRAEPFTQVERVRLENMVDEYRARADELRLRKEELKGPEKPAAAPAGR